MNPLQEYKPTKPPPENELFLCLVKTPSAQRWELARYDSQYKKICPWRNIYNNPVEQVTHYCKLPDMPGQKPPDASSSLKRTTSVPPPVFGRG